MKNAFKHNAIHLAIALVFLLVIVGGVLSFYNRQTMNKALIMKQQSDAVLAQIDLIHDNIRFMDISGRGYALIRKKEFLFWDVKTAQRLNKNVSRHLDSLFTIQHYRNSKYDKMKDAMDHYILVFAAMIDHLENNNMTAYVSMLEHDYGKAFYIAYTPLLDEITTYEHALANAAQVEYEAAVSRNVIVQALLFFLGLPTLLWIFYRIRRDDRERKQLLLNLELNNREYLFNDGGVASSEARDILSRSIDHLKEASRFVGDIASGNYDVQWHGLAPQNEKLNKTTLAGKLLFMRNEMKRIMDADKKRMWITQGLSDVSEIIRKHQKNLKDLNWHALTFLVRYCAAQQGSLFMVRKQGPEKFLELSACYAFERKKYLEKSINQGEGLIGEALLGGQTLLLRELPSNYIRITSGLGDATPTCLAIVPMKHNNEVLAIVEIASFNPFEPFQIDFLERAGEFMASAISTVAHAEKNKMMMEQLSSQTEQLRAQEEELRQNIEELETTQEVMRRQKL